MFVDQCGHGAKVHWLDSPYMQFMRVNYKCQRYCYLLPLLSCYRLQGHRELYHNRQLLVITFCSNQLFFLFFMPVSNKFCFWNRDPMNIIKFSSNIYFTIIFVPLQYLHLCQSFFIFNNYYFSVLCFVCQACFIDLVYPYLSVPQLHQVMYPSYNVVLQRKEIAMRRYSNLSKMNQYVSEFNSKTWDTYCQCVK